MARKKTTGSSSSAPASEPASSATEQPTTNSGRPRGQRRPAAPGEPTPRAARKKAESDAAAEEVRAVSHDLDERKQALESLRRHTHAVAVQLAALRNQAAALSREMEQTRSEASQEVERLAELRRQGLAVTDGLREAASGLAEVMEEMGEARGRLAELRREADEASRTAVALRTRSLEAATEIAEAAAEVRQMVQQTAVDTVEYATASALLGAEGDRISAETAAPEPVQLGIIVAADSGVILEVAPDSPAARAGIAPGDVVASANGEPVRNGEDLRSVVSRLSHGSEIVLRLERSGTSEEVRAHLSQSAASPPSA